MKNRTIIITLAIVTLLIGTAIYRYNYVENTERLELLESSYEIASESEKANTYNSNVLYFLNQQRYKSFLREVVRDKKTDKIIVDYINMILPYYNLTSDNTSAEYTARLEEISDITYAYKSKLSLDDRLKIVEFQVKAIKEK